MKERIMQLIDQVTPSVKEYRHQIHAHPELGLEEVETSALVQRELQRIGIPFQSGIAKTGVVGLIEGGKPGPCVALRADMDALPIQETTGLPWASKIPGISHACGHDTHTAMLLGAAEVLWHIRDSIAGSVKLLFQPAEECNPTGGMPAMIEQGILESPQIDAALALHVDSGMPTGYLGYRAGAVSASSNRFYITVKGKAAHGSTPEAGFDAIVAAAHVISSLQTVVSRNVRALDSAVLTIGTIHGGDRYNVIAEEVTMEGTCRTHSQQVTDAIAPIMERVIKGAAESLGCTYGFKFDRGYPPVVCDGKVTDSVKQALTDVLGEERLIYVPTPRMGGEDFSFLVSGYLQHSCA